MKANPETEGLVALVANRAVGVLHAALRLTSEWRNGYIEALRTSTGPERFFATVGSMLVNACSDLRFTNALAHRLPPEFMSLFWVELGERLIEDERCAFQHFGTFAAVRVSERIRIDYTSDLYFPRTAAPGFLELEGDHAWFASKISMQVIEPFRAERRTPQQSGSVPDWRLPLAFSELLSNCLPPILRDVLKTDACKDMAAASLGGWFDALGVTLSIATYYSWIVAFEAEIASNSDVYVNGAGRFFWSESKLKFEPSSQFLKILAANTKRIAYA